jgi:hypothetical protein
MPMAIAYFVVFRDSFSVRPEGDTAESLVH